MTCSASSSDPLGAGPEADREAGPVLVLCAVEERPAVVLADHGQVAASATDQGQGLAMAFLAPAVARVLARSGVSPGGLSGVACVRGPGSFTGIRVGLALCRGLCLGAGLPSWGLDALPLVARGAALRDPAAKRVAVAVHARRELVYFQAFDVADGFRPGALGPARVLPAREAAGEAATLAARTGEGLFRLAGTGLRNNREIFAACLPSSALAPDESAFPDPLSLALAATGPFRDRPVPAEPLYLRPSDAEENLAAVAGERGMSPKAARIALGAARFVPLS